MKRREFVALLGGAAAAWPLAARAQQPERIRLIGVITGMGVNADDADMQARFAAFQQSENINSGYRPYRADERPGDWLLYFSGAGASRPAVPRTMHNLQFMHKKIDFDPTIVF